jgi:hypothetical protein
MRRWLTGEPTLREVLDDPLIQLIMRRDCVDPDRLHAVLRGVGSRLPNVEVPPGQHYPGPTKSMGM